MRESADKPLGFPEFASSSIDDGASRPNRKAEWIRNAFSLVQEGDVKMACWFTDKETDWAVFGGVRISHI